KEMLPVGEIPIIEYNLRYLERSGISRAFIVLGERKEQILHYIRDGKRFSLKVAYLFQDIKEGVGTAKAISVAENWTNDSFVVLYGDTFFHPGDFIKELINYHVKKKAVATIGLYEVTSPERFGIVKLDNERIVNIIEKPSKVEAKSYLVDEKYLANSGPLVFDNIIFDYIRKTKPAQNGEYQITDTIKLMIEDNLPVYGFKIPQNVFWRDIGTPESRLEADAYVLKHKNIL
ncbi:MAG: NTP transferase domain-containing protein, partial [Candidatus Brockarchaeota archaeon]|nr:NTP transferase domain-containing protein [Candidatus Brockarchaeota archaeon]